MDIKLATPRDILLGRLEREAASSGERNPWIVIPQDHAFSTQDLDTRSYVAKKSNGWQNSTRSTSSGLGRHTGASSGRSRRSNLKTTSWSESGTTINIFWPAVCAQEDGARTSSVTG